MMINIVKEINDLLEYCIAHNISDIHLESLAEGFRLRLRRDGLLKTHKNYSEELKKTYFSRLKVMAALDVNSREVQDGRFSYQQVDIRVSCIPVFNGEKIVLRLLVKDSGLLDIQKLGLPEPIWLRLRQKLSLDGGLLLFTGPTGAGKTTTLYALLSELDRARKNIVTIEDPVEYQIAEVNQIQVDNEKGLTFERLFEAVLRQDPDVVFIGEIRNVQTAQTAFRAALTGHLVLATLHTGNAQESLLRLKNLDVADNLIAEVLQGVLSQKLVRIICPLCAGAGCVVCEQEGSRGRQALFEYYEPADNFFVPFACKTNKQTLLKK